MKHGTVNLDASDTEDALLEVSGLRVHYRPSVTKRRDAGRVIRAVDGVDFHIPRGRTLGLVGESGCGKTTVARAVLRLVPVTGGTIRYVGMDITKLSSHEVRAWQRDLRMVFQDSTSSLDSRMTVGASVAEPLVIQRRGTKRERRRRAEMLLTRVGLRAADADRYPHELSGGQRQRVGIAQALALDPKLLVLDEPVSALDVSVRAQIINLLIDLQRDQGLTYLFIAHDLSVVEQVSDVIAVMHRGTIVEMGGAETVIQHPRHPYTQLLLSSVPDPRPTAAEK